MLVVDDPTAVADHGGDLSRTDAGGVCSGWDGPFGRGLHVARSADSTGTESARPHVHLSGKRSISAAGAVRQGAVLQLGRAAERLRSRESPGLHTTAASVR